MTGSLTSPLKFLSYYGAIWTNRNALVHISTMQEFNTIDSMADLGYPRRGLPTPEGMTNLHENERNWPEREGASLVLPPA